MTRSLVLSDSGLSEKVQIEAIKEALRKQYRSSLYDTAKHLLGYGEMSYATHEPITTCLQSPSKRKLIVVPRGCFKSSIGSVSYPIWLLLNDPNRRILIDSELYTNAKNFLREIKAHLMSEEFRFLFGDWVGHPWSEGEIIVSARTRPKKEASITASGVESEKTSQHYDFIICDDLNSASNSNTVEGRMKVIDHYKRYVSLLEPDGTIVVIGTRYATEDLIGHILENEIEKK